MVGERGNDYVGERFRYAPLLSDEQKRAGGSPKSVGAVPNRVAESEILPEGKDREDGDSNGNHGCGAEEDDDDG